MLDWREGMPKSQTSSCQQVLLHFGESRFLANQTSCLAAFQVPILVQRQDPEERASCMNTQTAPHFSPGSFCHPPLARCHCHLRQICFPATLQHTVNASWTDTTSCVSGLHQMHAQWAHLMCTQQVPLIYGFSYLLPTVFCNSRNEQFVSFFFL